MIFIDVVYECYKNKEFISEYNRLFGTSINTSRSISHIESLIDKATGFVFSDVERTELLGFIDVVFNTVYLPLLDKEKG